MKLIRHKACRREYGFLAGLLTEAGLTVFALTHLDLIHAGTGAALVAHQTHLFFELQSHGFFA